MTPHDVPAETALGSWLHDALHDGDVAIDIGANAGDYTEICARVVGANGRVFAIEPAPDNVAALRQRFGDAGNVTVVAAAVADQAGSATLFLDSENPRRHSLARGNVPRGGAPVVVQQLALDDLCREWPRLDVIKIDAQGAELAILRGGAAVIARYCPAIALELWPRGIARFGVTPSAVLDQLRSAGYQLCHLSPKGVVKGEGAIERFLAEGTAHSINVVAFVKRRDRDRLAADR